MIKLAVFDLDCTLAEHGKGILEKDIVLLRRLEEKGVRIAIASGKPAYYLCGMFRQVGLREPILIGEVGASVQFGVNLPPKERCFLGNSLAVQPLLKEIKEQIEAQIPDIWLQPNEVNLSPFPKNEAEFAIVESIISKNREKLSEVNIYRYSDAIDFVPKGIDKGAAVRFLMQKLGLKKEEIAAVGDSSNDYPMFAEVGLSLGINLDDPAQADYQVNTCTQALEFIADKF